MQKPTLSDLFTIYLKPFLFSFGIFVFLILGTNSAFAAPPTTPPPNPSSNALPHFPGNNANYDTIITNNKLISTFKTDKGEWNDDDLWVVSRKLFTGESTILATTNKIIGGVAIFYLIIIGIKFMFARGKEESMSKYKQQFGWVVLGLAVVSAAEALAFVILNPEFDLLSSEAGAPRELLMSKMTQIRDYLRIIVGGILLLVLGKVGYHYITEGDNDDKAGEQRKVLISVMIGLVVIFCAEIILIIFQDMQSHDAQKHMIREIVGMVKFILSFVGLGALLMLTLATVYYVISFGNDGRTDKAKQLIIGAIIALVIALSLYWILYFMTKPFMTKDDIISNPKTTEQTPAAPSSRSYSPSDYGAPAEGFDLTAD